MQMVREIGTPADKIVREAFQRQDNAVHTELINAARHRIYKQGYAVKAKCVEELLKPTSLVPTQVNTIQYPLEICLLILPTQTAFSKFAGPAFNIYKILVVDLLHEVELGVWKAILQHLIRMLYSLGVDYVQELDKRSVAILRETAMFNIVNFCIDTAM
jgi:hypothetical protein